MLRFRSTPRLLLLIYLLMFGKRRLSCAIKCADKPFCLPQAPLSMPSIALKIESVGGLLTADSPHNTRHP